MPDSGAESLQHGSRGGGGGCLLHERGQTVGTLGALDTAQDTVPAGKQWTPPETLNLFGELGPLVLSAVPIMVLASFIGLSVANIMASDEGLGDVTTTIVTLIVFVVITRLLPVIMDFVVQADCATSEGYNLASNFGPIQTLMFAASRCCW